MKTFASSLLLATFIGLLVVAVAVRPVVGVRPDAADAVTRVEAVASANAASEDGMSTGADVMGNAVAESALALLVGREQYTQISAATGGTNSLPPLAEAVGLEGVEAVIWSTEFTQALVEEIQEGPLLELVMTAPLLSQALGGKGVLVGVDIPVIGFGSTSIQQAQIVEFQGVRSGSSTLMPQLTPGVAAAQVNALLDLMDVPSFLAFAKPKLKKFMLESPVLRRACTPSVLSRVMEGMIMKMKMFTPATTLTVKAKMQKIAFTEGDEPRTCLTGVAYEILNPQKKDLNTATEEDLKEVLDIGDRLAGRIIEQQSQRPFSSWEDVGSISQIGPRQLQNLKEVFELKVNAEGETALKLGMGTTLASLLGVQGIRYMLQRMQVEMVTFLRDSGLLLEVMTPAVLTRLLGATEMQFGIHSVSGSTVAGWFTPKTNSARVKCVCEGRCPSHEKGKLDNPALETIPDPVAHPELTIKTHNALGQVGYRCPSRNTRSAESGQWLTLPCCSSGALSGCVEGIGDVENRKADWKAACKKLGAGWHVGQRCMPSDPLLNATCHGSFGCVVVLSGQDNAGLSSTVRPPNGELFQTPVLSKAFTTGQQAATFAVGLLSGRRGDASMTELMLDMLGRRGFEQLLNSASMRTALADELKHGPLLGMALTASKLTELMGITPSRDTGIEMLVKLPVLQKVQIDKFIANDIALNDSATLEVPTAPALMLDHRMRYLHRSDVTSPLVMAGQAMGEMLDADRLLGLGVDCMDEFVDDETSCAFALPLVKFLRTSGVLLNVMHENDGAVLNTVMQGRTLDMIGPLNFHITNTIELVAKTREGECPPDATGGCPQSLPIVDEGEMSWRDGCPVEDLSPVDPADPDAAYVASMKSAMLSRLAEELGAAGLGALTGKLRPALLRALSEGKILQQVMTKDFIRSLMVGYYLKIKVYGVHLWGVPVCGVL